jgi:hypothetical protein
VCGTHHLDKPYACDQAGRGGVLCLYRVIEFHNTVCHFIMTVLGLRAIGESRPKHN